MSPEGVVLGADSTSTATVPDGAGAFAHHYLDYNQKLFELGDDPETATLAALTWGWGSFAASSHRTLLAQLVDSFDTAKPTSVDDIARLFSAQLWAAYSADLAVQMFKTLDLKPAYDATAIPPDPDARTEQEERVVARFRRDLVVGFCIGGIGIQIARLKHSPLCARPATMPRPRHRL
jgi:hypothetical protein